jgi:hypothetical protein
MAPMTSVDFDVEGPVQAEVFVVWLHGADLELTGPCGAAPWMIEVGTKDHPLDVVTRVVTATVGHPVLVHSTSWRRDRDAVVLTFLVVIEPRLVGAMESRPVGRAELARSTATSAPAEIVSDQVVEHALRHLAWLIRDDPAVSSELDEAWQIPLGRYILEPFRAFD